MLLVPALMNKRLAAVLAQMLACRHDVLYKINICGETVPTPVIHDRKTVLINHPAHSVFVLGSKFEVTVALHTTNALRPENRTGIRMLHVLKKRATQNAVRYLALGWREVWPVFGQANNPFCH